MFRPAVDNDERIMQFMFQRGAVHQISSELRAEEDVAFMQEMQAMQQQQMEAMGMGAPYMMQQDPSMMQQPGMGYGPGPMGSPQTGMGPQAGVSPQSQMQPNGMQPSGPNAAPNAAKPVSPQASAAAPQARAAPAPSAAAPATSLGTRAAAPSNNTAAKSRAAPPASALPSSGPSMSSAQSPKTQPPPQSGARTSDGNIAARPSAYDGSSSLYGTDGPAGANASNVGGFSGYGNTSAGPGAMSMYGGAAGATSLYGTDNVAISPSPDLQKPAGAAGAGPDGEAAVSPTADTQKQSRCVSPIAASPAGAADTTQVVPEGTGPNTSFRSREIRQKNSELKRQNSGLSNGSQGSNGSRNSTGSKRSDRKDKKKSDSKKSPRKSTASPTLQKPDAAAGSPSGPNREADVSPAADMQKQSRGVRDSVAPAAGAADAVQAVPGDAGSSRKFSNREHRRKNSELKRQYWGDDSVASNSSFNSTDSKKSDRADKKKKRS